MGSFSEILLLLVVGPLAGLGAGFLLSRSSVLSGWVALMFSLIPYAGLGLAIVFCWGHPLTLLGPSVMMVGLPLGTVYSGRATRKAPERRMAIAALALSLIALLGLGVVILVNMVDWPRNPEPRPVEDALQFLVRHGLIALFFIMLADQLALPVPMDIFIFAAGGLVGAGKLAFAPAVATLLVAGITGNVIWYVLGRRHGDRILGFLCRISVEPDSCVRRTQNLFTRHGVKALLLAKFVPGLNTVAAPLAGASRVPFPRFTLVMTAGLLLWIVPYLILGYVFRHQLEAAAAWATRLGTGFLWIFLGVVAAYFAYKFARRRHLFRKLRMARVTPHEVREMIDRNHPVTVIDLRHAMSVRSLPVAIPGAIQMTPDEVERRHAEIARDRDVVLYCAWPNEATSARVAQLLMKHGITRVRPLEGGLEAWRDLGFPLQARSLPEQAASW